jgi:hypothetical protein
LTVRSQGITEGKVNKLKTIKRQMYGRADFPFCGNGFYTMLDLHNANRGDELSSGFTKKLEEPIIHRR